MMAIFLQLHKLDSLQWPIATVDYPARGQAPEIFAMRLKLVNPPLSFITSFNKKARKITKKQVFRYQQAKAVLPPDGECSSNNSHIWVKFHYNISSFEKRSLAASKQKYKTRLPVWCSQRKP